VIYLLRPGLLFLAAGLALLVFAKPLLRFKLRTYSDKPPAEQRRTERDQVPIARAIGGVSALVGAVMLVVALAIQLRAG
jgi:hypothetical protein